MPDLELIRTSVTNVAHHLDARDWDALRALYADEVQVDYTSLFGGEPASADADALIAGWRDNLEPVAATQHLLGPITVDIEGDHALARCHVRGYHFAPGCPGGEHWMVAGHYVFGFVHDSHGWQISAMTLLASYQTGNTSLLEQAVQR